jgi:hypothetical protein
MNRHRHPLDRRATDCAANLHSPARTGGLAGQSPPPVRRPRCGNPDRRSGRGRGFWSPARTSVATSVPAAVTIADESPGVAELVDAADDSILTIGVTVPYVRGPFVAEGEGAGTGVVSTSEGLVLTSASSRVRRPSR